MLRRSWFFVEFEVMGGKIGRDVVVEIGNRFRKEVRREI